ncbi:MAG TPA: hypothetical protein VLA14_07980 [Polyangia bacterium]|nr:hypothetical protein [Polyangia bacterium]
MATNLDVKKGSDRSDAGDWTELERRFFESAPPDVAVPPPAPPRFDDLEPIARVERRSRPRSPSRPRAMGRAPIAPAKVRSQDRAAARAAQVGAWLRLIGTQVARRASAVRPAAKAIWAWGLEAGRRRLGPALRATRLEAGRRARLVAERAFVRLVDLFVNLFVDLPAERPDGKTTLAAAVALIVVCGLSASVLAHVRLTPPPAPDAVAMPAQPVAPR